MSLLLHDITIRIREGYHPSVPGISGTKAEDIIVLAEAIINFFLVGDGSR